MVRPLKPRNIGGDVKICYFKPQGIPLRSLNEIILEPDEFEAIRLHLYEGLNQTLAAQSMQISQPTFARILDRAQKKVAQALIEGAAIRIEKV